MTEVPNKKKKTLQILVIVAVACLFAAVIVMKVLNTGAKHISDQNGASDTSLAVLTRGDSLGGDDHTIFRHYVSGSGSASDASKTSFRYDDVDKDVISHKFGKISGVYTIHATKTDAQVLWLTITSALQSGNMEIVVVVDGQYYCSVPVNDTTQIVLEDISGKTVCVRVAGESAQAEVSVSRSYAR